MTSVQSFGCANTQTFSIVRGCKDETKETCGVAECVCIESGVALPI